MDEFGVTHHQVKHARALKKSKGILANPDPKLGHGLSNIENFYQDQSG